MLLSIKNLEKTYSNKKKALNDVTFNIDNNKIIGLIGPNGSGKTTLINCILDNLKYEKGKIIWHENDINKKSIFYIPDENILPDLLTGGEYLNFILELYGQADTSKINILLEVYDMHLDKNHPISSYSYGMKKKIQIIAAYLLSPKMLILDEPFRGLDVDAIITTKELLARFTKNDTTILLSSHDMLSAEQICDEIVMLNKGEVKVYGNPKELLKSYNTSNLEELFVLFNGRRDLTYV